jgi:hypothetical protein
MPIEFYTGGPSVRQLEVLEVIKPVFVRFMGGPDSVLKVWLHWRGTRSVPCMGDECKICPAEKFGYGYAPVLLYTKSGLNFHQGKATILPVTNRCLPIVNEDLRNKIMRVWRKGETKFGKMLMEIDSELDAKEFEPFNVLAAMEKIWRHLEKNPKRKTPDQHKQQHTLPFPEVG